MKNTQDKKQINTSKSRQASKKEELFSYSMKKDAGSVILTQEETGFTLALKVDQRRDTLRITKFTLTPSMQLAYLSPEIYDAALLGIIAHAVMILFGCAVELDTEEVLFLLSQDDVGHLAVFEGFFDDDEFLSPREGGKTLFTLYNNQETQELLRERFEYIITQINKGLWHMQRGNRYIKNFLQNHQPGVLLPGIEPQDKKINRCGTVIPFSTVEGINND